MMSFVCLHSGGGGGCVYLFTMEMKTSDKDAIVRVTPLGCMLFIHHYMYCSRPDNNATFLEKESFITSQVHRTCICEIG